MEFNMEKYISGAGICAGSYMLKWNMLDMHIHNKSLDIKAGDEVNIFINLECVLKNLSMQKGLQSIVNFHKQKFVIELESAILNLMANYRMYFQKEHCFPKLYFYMTSLDGEDQQMKVFNKYYRSFYHNRYMNNPQFKMVGEVLRDIIIPEIKLILLYVPGCYYIESKTFDSSIIPKVISGFSSAKNIIITGDVFDTLYLFDPNFITVYIKRRFKHFNVLSDIDTTVQSIVKDESPFDLTLFNAEMYFRLLLSIKGSKIRNIKSAKGFGYGKFLHILKQGVKNDIVLKDFESIDSIIELFPENYRNDIKTAFQCTSIDTQYNLLSEADIESVRSQMIDKVDIESIEALNNKRFLDYPINLQGLLN